MNELAIKIAELLDITVEKAIELYPMLRTQYLLYDFLGSFSLVFIMVLIFSILATVILSTFYFVEFSDGHGDDESEQVLKKVLINAIKLVAISLIVLIVLKAASLLLAPDIRMMLLLK